MPLIGRYFTLSDAPGGSVTCGTGGVFVGEVSLLQRSCPRSGFQQWEPRPVRDLNRDLSMRYGLPIDINIKTGGLIAIAGALNRGDLLHAQITTLHLQIPNPPPLTKSAHTTGDIVALARQLQASGLLKADWDPLKHPRWPAGAPGGIGGEFAPRGDVADDSATDEHAAPLIPAQLTLPAPFDWVVPRGAPLPWPSEIAPAPLAPPDASPIIIPRNPYPGRPKCVREWRTATQDCLELWADDQLGRDYIRGMGTTIRECIMGRVSQDCGGNSVDA